MFDHHIGSTCVKCLFFNFTQTTSTFKMFQRRYMAFPQCIQNIMSHGLLVIRSHSNLAFQPTFITTWICKISHLEQCIVGSPWCLLWMSIKCMYARARGFVQDSAGIQILHQLYRKQNWFSSVQAARTTARTSNSLTWLYIRLNKNPFWVLLNRSSYEKLCENQVLRNFESLPEVIAWLIHTCCTCAQILLTPHRFHTNHMATVIDVFLQTNHSKKF